MIVDWVVNGKFLEYEVGDCVGINIDEENKLVWWNIFLLDLVDIYKINLMFR